MDNFQWEGTMYTAVTLGKKSVLKVMFIQKEKPARECGCVATQAEPPSLCHQACLSGGAWAIRPTHGVWEVTKFPSVTRLRSGPLSPPGPHGETWANPVRGQSPGDTSSSK